MRNQTLIDFEALTGLGPTRAARLLGVAYPSYNQVRNGRRSLQQYTARHIEALTLLQPDTLARLIKEHVENGN